MTNSYEINIPMIEAAILKYEKWANELDEYYINVISKLSKKALGLSTTRQFRRTPEEMRKIRHTGEASQWNPDNIKSKEQQRIDNIHDFINDRNKGLQARNQRRLKAAQRGGI